MTTDTLTKSGVGAIARSTHPAPTHDHSVKIALAEEDLTFAFACTADESAPCRVMCEEGCESWGEDHHDLTGHTMQPYPRCLFVEWMDALGQNNFFLSDSAMTGSGRVLFEGAVEPNYDDGYAWAFIDETKDGGS